MRWQAGHWPLSLLAHGWVTTVRPSAPRLATGRGNHHLGPLGLLSPSIQRRLRFNSRPLPAHYGRCHCGQSTARCLSLMGGTTAGVSAGWIGLGSCVCRGRTIIAFCLLINHSIVIVSVCGNYLMHFYYRSYTYRKTHLPKFNGLLHGFLCNLSVSYLPTAEFIIGLF